ncbi:MAG: aldehyde dehydrogenase family protein [Planctomycetota bacterium]
MESEIVSLNPGRNFEELGRTRCSTRAQIESAVLAAKRALPEWRRLTVDERCRYVDRFRELLQKHANEVAELQSKEMGKPIAESRQELVSSIRFLKNQTEKASRLLATRVLDSYSTHQTEARYEPYGVAAVITPWNFPTGQFVANSSQTLLAGNVVVLKHSEECVLTSKLLGKLACEAEFPDGVFQVLYGAEEVAKFLLAQDIEFVHFTGSSAVGKEIYRSAAAKFLPVTLEMGGSSPAIVTQDVDVAAAARSIFYERFKNCGQICCALKRLYVQEGVFDTLMEELCALAESQVVGDPLDPATTLGPLAAARQVDVLEDQLGRGIQDGASVVSGGSRLPNSHGAYFEPTIVEGVSNDSPLMQEEVFGPVLPMMPFKEIDDAIALANDSRFGLSAFVYGKELKIVERIVSELEAGQVSVNGASYFSNRAPFGGYKDSGIGRVRGDEGYFDVTQAKVVGRPTNRTVHRSH